MVTPEIHVLNYCRKKGMNVQGSSCDPGVFPKFPTHAHALTSSPFPITVRKSCSPCPPPTSRKPGHASWKEAAQHSGQVSEASTQPKRTSHIVGNESSYSFLERKRRTKGEGRENIQTTFVPSPSLAPPKIKSQMESSVYRETRESQDFGKPLKSWRNFLTVGKSADSSSPIEARRQVIFNLSNWENWLPLLLANTQWLCTLYHQVLLHYFAGYLLQSEYSKSLMK